MKINKIPIKDILHYEVASHWLTIWVGFDWGQNLIINYITWKTLRKYKRYEKFIK